MTKPRKAGSLLKAATILKRMIPGRAYRVFEVAALTGTSASTIRSMLADMVAHSQLELVNLGERTPGFRRPIDAEALAVEEQMLSTIAAPRTFAVLTGTLVGYDAEIARRADLCMLARRT
ncbi:hypothetical protein SAMN05444172_2618 [Burkholderia sp. GAS332]|nr:hypothetical protein SAMN05444172_2618 [Burkholderia sp. GAS332]